MDRVCQSCLKECSTRTCEFDNYCCWKTKLKAFMRPWFHGCIKTPIIRQSVNKKKVFKWFTNSRKITLKTIKTPQSIKKTCYNAKCTNEYRFTLSVQPYQHIKCQNELVMHMKLPFTPSLRFHFQSLFDEFDTFNTFKWCIMPPDKSIAMIKITKLST